LIALASSQIMSQAESIFDLIEAADTEKLFPKSLNNAVTLWVRMRVPLSTKQLVNFLAGGKVKHSHSKKGWQAGMALVLISRSRKGIQLTSLQNGLVSNHSEHSVNLARLVLDVKAERELVWCEKLGMKINIITELLDEETRKWLALPWPETFQQTNQLPGSKPVGSSQLSAGNQGF